jgi:hypothetical protein
MGGAQTNHHAHCATPTFFGGLKNQIQSAVKRGITRQGFGGGQQHGSVPVMAACVHEARLATGPIHACGFLNGQSIHVSTQT